MKFTIISGSTRDGRTSHRVALMLQNQLLKHNFDAEIIDLKALALPPFRERYHMLENKSEEQIAIADRLCASTALIFVTPEYNGGITGALKEFTDFYGKHEFAGKPIGVATVSTGALGGMRAAMQLQPLILALQAYPQPQMLLTGEVLNQINESGEIINPAYQTKVNTFLHALIKFSERFALPVQEPRM